VPIGDFEGDEAAIAAYEGAKLVYVRSVTRDAEFKLRAAFLRRRDALLSEMRDLRDLVKVRVDEANVATAAYALELPHRVRKTGVRPPSVWERMRSLNRVEGSYRKAARAASELDGANDMLRKRRARLAAIEGETRRSISQREESVRKRLQTPEGFALLHDDPLVRRAVSKLRRHDERAPDHIAPEDARDREMSQRGQQFAVVPLHAVMIARIARYGPLEYFVLRDLTKREYLLSCDPALEPLRDYVFDLTHSAAGYEAALRHSTTELPMRILDHLKACFPANEAIDLYARHREQLRTDRVTRVTPPRDETEAEMIAMLRLLAQAVSTYAAHA
jgi:hypothetical protein